MTLRSNTGGANRGAAGFTLIEMIVAIAILGLALSVVVGFAPRRHGRLELDNAANGLAETLRLARAGAIARSTPVLFAPTRDGGGYAVDGVVRRLPPSVVLTAAPAIRFAPDGSASGGTLRLANGSGTQELRVDWLTGQVAVAGGE
jgi:general secretion pathway protein H